MATQSRPTAAQSVPSYMGPFITVTVLYFILGFITNLNMGLVPYLRNIFEVQKLQVWQAMLANGAFFTAYLVSGPAAKLIGVIGYKRTIIVSIFVQVIGLLLILPAAKLVSFPLFLVAIFIVGAGIAALQTALNPYVVILGPEHSAPARLTLAQALNSLGGTIAPYVAGAFFLTAAVLNPDVIALKSAADQHTYQVGIADTVRIPYLLIALAMAILGIIVVFLRLPHVEPAQSTAKDNDVNNQSIWHFKHTVLSAVGIFAYVGVEAGLATTMVLYFSDFKHGGLSILLLPAAQKLVMFYWLGALIGRLMGSWMLTKIKAGKLLGIFGMTAAALVLLSILITGQVSIWSLILCGFFNSIMFPNIFALGVAGLGPMTSKGSGLITTAIVGGAVIPVVIGFLVSSFSYQIALLLPMLCYLYIAYYGFIGSKPTRSLTA